MKKKRLITSALPYVNNAPHLGNIIGSVLSADVYARYCRLSGYDTLYICGTDGYGTATETKAKQENMTPAEICEQFHKIHEGIYEDFNISFDAFGKTFDPRHTDTVQSMYQNVATNDNFIEQQSEQTWCDPCEKFLADRLVTGECPHCHFTDARGDQCDGCSKLLAPTELISPKCSVCEQAPSLKSTKHLYLDLPKLTEKLKQWQEDTMTTGEWTQNAKTTTHSWMDKGLNPRPITRDLKWGVPVPKEGYESKVFYVWFDAPIGYISITQKAFPDTWQDWWLNSENVNLYQFMGKDNIPFHSVIFPATQLASGQPWTMAHQLNVTEYIIYEGEKFSKSRNVGVFGTDVAEIGLPIDFWRFYLLSIRPERHDSGFLWSDFFDKINNELIDNVGNLVNRVMVYHQKNFPGKYKAPSYNEAHLTFIETVKDLQKTYLEHMELGELKDGIKTAMLVGKAGNRFFHEQEPWKKIKEVPDEVETTLLVLVHLVRDLGLMLSPFIPETATKILTMIGTTETDINALGDFKNLTDKQSGKVEILFKKLDTKLIDVYKEKYGGDKQVSFEDMDIRIGEIISCEKHPDSDNLFVEQINIGEEQLIQVVSGLQGHYTTEELIGRKVLTLVNLAPAKIRGVKSAGMVLVAATRKKMEILENNELPVGSRVAREGFPIAESPLPEIDFETFVGMKMVIENHQILYKGQQVELQGKPLTTKQIKQGKVK